MKKIIFPLLIFTAIGCNRIGCSDTDATNYSHKAVKADASCTYEGSAVFWWDEAAMEHVTNTLNINSLTFYINDEEIATESADNFWNEIPDCDEKGVIKYTHDLKFSKTHAVRYKVFDTHHDEEVWSGILSLDANSCQSVKLGF